MDKEKERWPAPRLARYGRTRADLSAGHAPGGEVRSAEDATAGPGSGFLAPPSAEPLAGHALGGEARSARDAPACLGSGLLLLPRRILWPAMPLATRTRPFFTVWSNVFMRGGLNPVTL